MWELYSSIENTKEFMALWTKMAMTCFDRCVNNLQNTNISKETEEYNCVENCVGKVNL